MSLLKDLTWYFQEAGLEAKRKLLGSIFPAKLTFQDGKYRTAGLNPALTIILQKTKNLENEKRGDIIISENISGDVPATGLPLSGRTETARPVTPFPKRDPVFSGSDSARRATAVLISRPKNADAFFRRQKKAPVSGAPFLPFFAGDRTRTSILLLRVDFESTASTNFATPA